MGPGAATPGSGLASPSGRTLGPCENLRRPRGRVLGDVPLRAPSPCPMDLLLLTALAALPSPLPQDPADAPPPHIVVLMIDDLGARDTSPALWPDPEGPGARHHRTPHLERLAAGGVVVDEGYASAPVCTPTRTSLMTGMTPARTGITYWTRFAGRDTSAGHPLLAAPPWRVDGLQPGDVTLAGLLRDAGYRTIHVGKAHFGTGEGGDPTALGFDVNVAGWAAGGPGSYLGVDGFSADGRERRRGRAGGNHDWDVPGLGRYHGQEVFLTDVLAAEAEAALRAAVAEGERVFLHFAPYAVHAPLMVNPRVAPRFEGAGLEGPELAYATLVASVDDAVGRILDTLDALGIADETLVVYTGDNGGLSAHGRGGPPHTHNLPFRSGKGSAYEGGIRVPLVARWPGRIPAGTRVRGPVITHDLFPTLLAAARTQAPPVHAARVDGVDVRAVLAGSAPAPLRPLLWHQPHYWGVAGPGIEPFSALRLGDHKLVYFHSGADFDPRTGRRTGGPRLELYDLRADPGERDDLAAEDPTRVAALAQTLSLCLEASGAAMSLRLPDRVPVPLPRFTASGR